MRTCAADRGRAIGSPARFRRPRASTARQANAPGARTRCSHPLERAQVVSPLGRLLFDDTNPTDASCAKKRCRGKASSCGGLYQAARLFDGVILMGWQSRKSVGRGEARADSEDAID